MQFPRKMFCTYLSLLSPNQIFDLCRKRPLPSFFNTSSHFLDRGTIPKGHFIPVLIIYKFWRVTATIMLHRLSIWTVLASAVMVAGLLPMSFAITDEVSEPRLLMPSEPTDYKSPKRKKKPPTCPRDDQTKGKLNSCLEQKKCFSISYKPVADDKASAEETCEEPTCGFKWKVCIEINNKDPCCRKKSKRTFFKKACIRGKHNNRCLDNDDSVEDFDAISKLRNGYEVCEFVRPGDNAIFQLVRLDDNRCDKILCEWMSFECITDSLLFALHKRIVTNSLQQDGKKCKGGRKGSVKAQVIGDGVEDKEASCFSTKKKKLDTCLDDDEDSCSWIFETPGCPATPAPTPLDIPSSSEPTPRPTKPTPNTPAPTPKPTPNPTRECPAGDIVAKGSLNSCSKQEKCFSISYKRIEGGCDEPDCNFRWEVCIDFNNDDPCCRKKDEDMKGVFRNACIRGNTLRDTCADDSITFVGLEPITPVNFRRRVCEIVRPGNDALFQLVSA